MRRPHWLRPSLYIRGRRIRSLRGLERFILLAALAVSAVFVVLAVSAPASGAAEGPEISIVSVENILDYNGNPTLLITYAVDGLLQAQAFADPGRLEKYLGYLGRVGRVTYLGGK